MIHIVTALQHEARPLIDFYSLKSVQNNPYQIYRNENIHLIVSGVGKKNSFDAAIYLHDFSGKNRNCGWLNIGIGGHSKRNIGAGALAHKITDQTTGKNWYPPRILKTNCSSECILTVEKIETNYYDSVLYDMESSGFYEAASSCSTSELVQCFKIVSDNLSFSSKKVSGALVRSLVEQNLKLIDSIVRELSKLSSNLDVLDAKPKELDQFLERRHFTVTESHQLRRLLSRLGILFPEEKWFDRISHCKKSGEILTYLEHQFETVYT